MAVYKILRPEELAVLAAAGGTFGAPADLADGFVHLSSAAQVAATLEKHFAGEDGLWLVACDPGAMGAALRWEPSRGGPRFPHLFRRLDRGDILWVKPLPFEDGAHRLPPDLP